MLKQYNCFSKNYSKTGCCFLNGLFLQFQLRGQSRFPPKIFITSTTSFNPSVRIAYQEDPVGVQVELVPNVLKNRISGGVENVNTDFALKKCFQNFQKLRLSI